MPFARRSDAEVGFGLGGALLWYPYLAADATGQKRFGLRLNSGPSLHVGMEFGRMDVPLRSDQASWNRLCRIPNVVSSLRAMTMSWLSGRPPRREVAPAFLE